MGMGIKLVSKRIGPSGVNDLRGGMEPNRLQLKRSRTRSLYVTRFKQPYFLA
jgi:hypothetical protein